MTARSRCLSTVKKYSERMYNVFIKTLSSGMLGSNCYIVGNSGEGVIIDPGTDGDDIKEEIEKTGIKIKYLILTHTHIDHICALDYVRALTGAKAAVHSYDAGALEDPRGNASYIFGLDVKFRKADIFLKDGDVLEAGGIKLEIIHTPGHTPGGICISTGKSLFTGDTLFKLSVGRTDLGNGDENLLFQSLGKLMSMDEDISVYPGHGPSTTIGYEKKNNPYCNMLG